MSTTEAARIFRQHIKGTNFMTPTPEGFYTRGEYVCELSSGRGISNEPIFGVTVVHSTEGRTDDLSKMFHDREEALQYVQSLAVVSFKAPPVCTANWDTEAWLRWEEQQQ